MTKCSLVVGYLWWGWTLWLRRGRAVRIGNGAMKSNLMLNGNEKKTVGERSLAIGVPPNSGLKEANQLAWLLLQRVLYKSLFVVA